MVKRITIILFYTVKIFISCSHNSINKFARIIFSGKLYIIIECNQYIMAKKVIL